MKTNKKGNNYNKGLTLIETFIALGIISLTLMIGGPAFKSFFCRMEIDNGLRTVTSAISSARYNAIMMNIPVKFTIEGNRIVLKQKAAIGWEEIKDFKLEKNVSFSLNASPVFYPTGSIVPLCSIYVQNERYSYKISISMEGQVKIYNLT